MFRKKNIDVLSIFMFSSSLLNEREPSSLQKNREWNKNSVRFVNMPKYFTCSHLCSSCVDDSVSENISYWPYRRLATASKCQNINYYCASKWKKKVRGRSPAIRCVLCECGGSFKVNPLIVDSLGIFISLGHRQAYVTHWRAFAGFHSVLFLSETTSGWISSLHWKWLCWLQYLN